MKENRLARRKKEKSIHHNVFTKKYKTKRHLNGAWRLFLGEDFYRKLKKEVKIQK